MTDSGEAFALSSELLLAGDRHTLTKAISAAENGSAAAVALAREARMKRPPHAGVVGITGPPGAGKSTLVSAMITKFREAGQRVGVLLIDPSSAATGGAVLADRVRLRRQPQDSGLFVRSVAARGHPGGVTSATTVVIELLDAWGADIVLVETVGAGQGEIDIASRAHVTVVVCPPGLGDDLQAMKAGLMEIADVFVVNKADLPGADATVASLRVAGLGGRDRSERRVLKTIATQSAGVSELVQEITQRLATGPQSTDAAALSPGAATRQVAAAAAERARTFVTARSQELAPVIEAVVTRHLTVDEAAVKALHHLCHEAEYSTTPASAP